VIINGDSREILADMIERGETVHSIVTDPPYGLVSVVKRFGKEGSAPAKSNGATGVYKRVSAGFMGQAWDGTGIEQDPTFWRLCHDVLLPGGHLLAFGGTRTWHRIACAIEDAGFEVRDCLMWLYGTGFPKSHNQGEGRGTALKPAWEPIFMFRKPPVGTVAQNVLAHGTGALNIDGCRIEMQNGETNPSVAQRQGAVNHLSTRPAKETEAEGKMVSRQSPEAFRRARSGEALGRWPANLIGSDDLPQDFWRFFYTAKASKKDRNSDWQGNPLPYPNAHPTVKPTDLVQWLVRLVTPPGGTVLDPFTGSGSTGVAARREGFRFIGIEQDPRHTDFAAMRVGGSDFEAKLARLREAIRRNEEARDAAR
jgi:site-specific DNA-methyltransferase (adenine-specific)